MGGYSQVELSAIYQAAGLSSAVARRFADIITKYYNVVTPSSKYDTRDYLAMIFRPVIEVGLACYGRHYSLANLIQAVKNAGYPDIWATNIAETIIAVYACIAEDIGAEVLTETAFTTHANWAIAGDFDDTGGNATYTDSAHSGTLTQTSGNFATAMVADRWYKFDYEVSGVSGASNITYCRISTAVSASVENLEVSSNGLKTALFFSAAAPGNFVLQGASSGACAFTIDNVSLKLVGATKSTNPLSVSFVLPTIDKVVEEMSRMLRAGEYSLYNR